MPVGLSPVPRISTKLTQEISSFCRKHGIHLISYLDDTIIIVQSKALALQHHNSVFQVLLSLGFIINLEKKDLSSSKSFTFLGLKWNSVDHSVALMGEKHLKLQLSMFTGHNPSCWDIQLFLGRTNFASFAVPWPRLNSQAIEFCFSAFYHDPSDRFKDCPLDTDARKEIQCWVDLSLYSKPLVPPIPTVTISTDASWSGWGAVWND